MSDFKLLQFPTRDATLNRIDSLKSALNNDDTGEYIDELMLMLINWCAEFSEDYTEITRCEQKLIEARGWLWEHYSDKIDVDKTEEEKKEE